MKQANTAPEEKPRAHAFTFPLTLLRGAGQVMFQNNAWTGALFLIGIFWGSYANGTGLVAWGALLGLAVSTVTGYLLELPEEEGTAGLWGFNGILVGCAFPTFLGNSVWMWLALALCAALTTWVRTGFNYMAASWKINSLTFPFVLCTWIFLLAARAMHGLPDLHLADPELPDRIVIVRHFGGIAWLVGWLKGVSQVFLIDSWVTGLFFLAGLAVSNYRAALWAAIGSALSLTLAIVLGTSGADCASGLYGFSAVLTAIALATVFYQPGIRSALWALLGICVTLFVQAGMNVWLAPVGIATLTAPFCLVTWLFLLPRIRFDLREQVDHSQWHRKDPRP